MERNRLSLLCPKGYGSFAFFRCIFILMLNLSLVLVSLIHCFVSFAL